MTDVTANLARVRAAIADAAASAGRTAETIRLIAVSKTHPAPALAAAHAAGQRAFGESTVQEALGKIAHFAECDVEWHFIGHLQSNKAKFVPGNFAWLHSLDSLKLAERLERFAQPAGVTLHALIEVNVTGDPRKHGVAPDRLDPLLDALLAAGLRHVRLRGLMTIGPYGAAERDLRAAFAALRTLAERARERYRLPDFTELSMGMSGDYVEAIKEGATMLRIGSAIFGARDYGSRA
ncbi:MAG TPA: YggS family pyridoxal phosphate-dependent enzyme [Burkholderiales bacterium]